MLISKKRSHQRLTAVISGKRQWNALLRLLVYCIKHVHQLVFDKCLNLQGSTSYKRKQQLISMIWVKLMWCCSMILSLNKRSTSHMNIFCLSVNYWNQTVIDFYWFLLYNVFLFEKNVYVWGNTNAFCKKHVQQNIQNI